MNEILPVILIVGGCTAIVLAARYFRKKRRESRYWTASTETRVFKILETIQPVMTGGGHEVYNETGNPAISQSVLDAYDRGVERTFQKLECAGYPVDRAKHRIRIVVFRAEADSQGNPCFRVPIWPMNNPYFNDGVYDKMTGVKGDPHYILASGQMIAAGDPYGDVIVVPYATTDQLQFASTIAEYETEHTGLAWYDFPRYEATRYHVGSGHPIVPDCPGVMAATFLTGNPLLEAKILCCNLKPIE